MNGISINFLTSNIIESNLYNISLLYFIFNKYFQTKDFHNFWKRKLNSTFSKKCQNTNLRNENFLYFFRLIRTVKQPLI